jgi:hypothetical protein
MMIQIYRLQSAWWRTVTIIERSGPLVSALNSIGKKWNIKKLKI